MSAVSSAVPVPKRVPLKHSFFTVDQTMWPLVFVELWASPTEESQVRELVDALKKLLDYQQKYAMIFAGLHHIGIGTAWRYGKHITEWIKQDQERSARYLAGTGIVIESDLARGIFNAVLSMRPPTRPYKLCDTRIKAYNYAKQQHALFATADTTRTTPA